MARQPKKRYAPDWQTKYAEMICSPAEAVGRIRPGSRIFIGTGCAMPQELVNALAARGPQLADCEIVHLLTFGAAPYAQKQLAEHFRVNTFFIAENVRDIIQEGLGDYTPIFLSDIPRLFSSGQLPLDVALIHVTPPDERGMVSLGISVDIVKSAAENASLVIAQVNPQMPFTHGDSCIPVYDLDVLVPVDTPLIEVPTPKPDEVTRQIGENIAALVDDGATLELGIGRIPHAVLESLRGKKDLGIHTEMCTDGIVDMASSEVINGARKTLDRGKIVVSFCMGTDRLYDFIDDNPVMAFHPTEYVNDPHVISRQHSMVAINVALEIDLTGQVCADSLGTRFFSGIGGQVDFNRGAARARDGKAIIALPSTAKGGQISRIVSRLSPGAGVVTTRGDVHYVVTEHGVAYLHGKSVQERALALISIAHPDYRAKLLHDAIDLKYLRPDFARIEGKFFIGPRELNTTMLLDDGAQIAFRPIHPMDEPRLKDLFHRLSRETVYYRFMKAMPAIPQKQIQDFIYIDHRNEVAIVGTVPEAHGDELVAVARYYLNPKTNRAEVAFIVRDDWQDRGVGTFMLKHLIAIARRSGISGFTAEVLKENRPMQSVLQKSGCKVKSSLNEDVYSFELEFA
jgi:acyl-CoA hydrolase/RimJ/RimL family protein N-acetyltransferase